MLPLPLTLLSNILVIIVYMERLHVDICRYISEQEDRVPLIHLQLVTGRHQPMGIKGITVSLFSEQKTAYLRYILKEAFLMLLLLLNILVTTIYVERLLYLYFSEQEDSKLALQLALAETRI